MGFFHSRRTFRSGKTYNQYSLPRMFVNAEVLANASGQTDSKKISANNDRISIECTEKGTGANLRPLKKQSSSITQLLNQLIADDSAKTKPTTGSRTQRLRTGPALGRKTGAYRTSLDKWVEIRTRLSMKNQERDPNFTDRNILNCYRSTIKLHYNARILETKIGF